MARASDAMVPLLDGAAPGTEAGSTAAAAATGAGEAAAAEGAGGWGDTTGSGPSTTTGGRSPASGRRRRLPRPDSICWRPICTANWPTRRAVRTCPSTRWRPLSTSFGNSSAAVSARPAGPNTNRSSRRSLGDFSSSWEPPVVVRSSLTDPPRRVVGAGLDRSHAVAAQHLVGVGQLARVLHQEARPAHEFVRLLGQDALGALAPVVGLGDLVVLLLFVLDDEALLQDLVQAGLDVLVVDVLVLVLALFGDGGDGGLLGLLLFVRDDVVIIFVVVHRVGEFVLVLEFVLVEQVVVAQILEVLGLELLGFVDFVQVFRHPQPFSRSSDAGGAYRLRSRTRPRFRAPRAPVPDGACVPRQSGRREIGRASC